MNVVQESRNMTNNVDVGIGDACLYELHNGNLALGVVYKVEGNEFSCKRGFGSSARFSKDSSGNFFVSNPDVKLLRYDNVRVGDLCISASLFGLLQGRVTNLDYAGFSFNNFWGGGYSSFGSSQRNVAVVDKYDKCLYVSSALMEDISVLGMDFEDILELRKRVRRELQRV